MHDGHIRALNSFFEQRARVYNLQVANSSGGGTYLGENESQAHSREKRDWQA